MFDDLDLDGNKELDFVEFKRGMNEFCGMDLSFDEAKMCFNLFDTNGDGFVSFEEFMFAILPPLSEKRSHYVEAAFRSFNPSNIDLDGDGIISMEEKTITLEDIYNRIDMSFHPSVVRNTTTKTEMFRQFLCGFEGDVGEDVDYQEFLQYCTTLSVHCITNYEFGHTVIEMFNVDRKFVKLIQDELEAKSNKKKSSPRNEQLQVERQQEFLRHQKDHTGWQDHTRAGALGVAASNHHDYSGASLRLRRKMHN
jgi:hypothetical protein|tara:strand:+ start:754 stop:1509 length:756 start_codon:yes stop_codon:yes gene_type:complete